MPVSLDSGFASRHKTAFGFNCSQITRLLGGQMYIDSSGSGVGQLLVKQSSSDYIFLFATLSQFLSTELNLFKIFKVFRGTITFKGSTPFKSAIPGENRKL